MSLRAATTSSGGMTLRMPARDISAAIMATETPMALRLMQGTSTGLAGGSQMRPRVFLMAKAAPWATASGEPPASQTAPPAAMPAPMPISAWQPPMEPEKLQVLPTTMPTAAATRKDSAKAVSSLWSCWATVNSTPGRVPADPEVGTATKSPAEALISSQGEGPGNGMEKVSPAGCGQLWL